MKRLVAAFDSSLSNCAARTRANAGQEHALPRGDTTIIDMMAARLDSNQPWP